MDVKTIATIGRRLKPFLGHFADCFNRSEPRDHLKTYVNGQVSGLHRKSVEPMALKSGTPPRTLQQFLGADRWDEQRLRDRMQWLVASEHADREAIGIIDETSTPKCGKHTACVHRQWCGNKGKRDNCVVSVHTSYVADDFHCILDSDLFMPEVWAEDLPRRQMAHVPDVVEFRTKPQIALDQVTHALRNGVRVAAWTFDELYGMGSEFLDGVQALGQNYVGEIPVDFRGWLQEPQVLLRPTSQELHKRGRKRHFPRLARKALPACEVRNLLKHSPIFRKQKWQRFKIKDGEKGPAVWEVKHAIFYRKQHDGMPSLPQYLIVARNVLDPTEIKFFISNVLPSADTPLQWLLRVAFSRYPIEQCFRQAKDDLGMDHFEVRGWQAIHRHFYISQLSLLFCSRVQQELQTKKNNRRGVPHRRDDSPRSIGSRRDLRHANFGSSEDTQEGRRHDQLPSSSQSRGSAFPHEEDDRPTSRDRHRSREITLMRPR
jgi:SRSO17 transposase